MEWIFVLAEDLPLLAVGMLLFAGGYFTLRFRAFYLRHPLRTLCTMPLAGGAKEMLLSLGGTVGVGNISGVAVALMLGGAGAVLWMWVGALVSMALKYAEITLGMCTRRGDVGGAAYYVKEAIGRVAAILFTLLMLIDCVTMGGMIQSSAIAEAAGNAFGMSSVACGIFVSATTAAVFFLGIDLFKLSAYVVPTMSIGYVLAALAVIFVHAGDIPAMLAKIFSEAVTPSAAAGGALGFLFSPALKQGIVKGLFSNEAGCGTAPSAHIASKEVVPAKQGLLGILEVFIDTVLMCSLTAFVILLTLGDSLDGIGGGGVTVCVRAFSTLLGNAAPPVLAVFIFLFAFATIVSFGYYGTKCLEYFHIERRGKDAFLILYCLSLFGGAVAAPTAVWSIADAVICMMLLLNTTAVFASRKQVLTAHGDLLRAAGNTFSHPHRKIRAQRVQNLVFFPLGDEKCDSHVRHGNKPRGNVVQTAKSRKMQG